VAGGGAGMGYGDDQLIEVIIAVDAARDLESAGSR